MGRAGKGGENKVRVERQVKRESAASSVRSAKWTAKSKWDKQRLRTTMRTERVQGETKGSGSTTAQGAPITKLSRQQGAPLLAMGFKFNLLCKESDAKVKQNPRKNEIKMKIETKRPKNLPFPFPNLPLPRIPNECQWNANSQGRAGGWLQYKGYPYPNPRWSNRLGCSSHYQFE